MLYTSNVVRNDGIIMNAPSAYEASNEIEALKLAKKDVRKRWGIWTSLFWDISVTEATKEDIKSKREMAKYYKLCGAKGFNYKKGFKL